MSGGSAWTRDHDKILDHARGLHYDHVPGVTLPSDSKLMQIRQLGLPLWMLSMIGRPEKFG